MQVDSMFLAHFSFSYTAWSLHYLTNKEKEKNITHKVVTTLSVAKYNLIQESYAMLPHQGSNN